MNGERSHTPRFRAGAARRLCQRIGQVAAYAVHQYETYNVTISDAPSWCMLSGPLPLPDRDHPARSRARTGKCLGRRLIISCPIPLSRATAAVEPFWCSPPARSGHIPICINMGRWTIVYPRGVPRSALHPAGCRPAPDPPHCPARPLTEAFRSHEIQISR